jgi:hypothetical protein
LDERLGLLAELRGNAEQRLAMASPLLLTARFWVQDNADPPRDGEPEPARFAVERAGGKARCGRADGKLPAGGAQQQAAAGQGSMPAPGEGSTAPAKPTGVFMASIRIRSQGLPAECTSWLHTNCRGAGGRRPSPLVERRGWQLLPSDLVNGAASGSGGTTLAMDRLAALC